MACKENMINFFQDLDGWEFKKNKTSVEKLFQFIDFQTAFTFMTVVAFKAEELDHHPEWSNVYSKVRITLTTHDKDGLTTLDKELAIHIDNSASILAHLK